MALHPILALNHVVEEYRDYIRTEFRAKDPKLKEALERELDQPLFLAQEPFFQAHRPFKSGKRWSELPIDPRLAQVMEKRAKSTSAYLHQSEAIAHLLGPEASPLVVTTGTGSGKTEAFLLCRSRSARALCPRRAAIRHAARPGGITLSAAMGPQPLADRRTDVGKPAYGPPAS